MRHRVSSKRLSRTSSHRKAMLQNMANSLIKHEQIKTTIQKAKMLRPYVERLVTIAKKEGLFSKKRLLSLQRSNDTMVKLCDDLSVRYANRNGGYLRIMRSGFRYGDNAEMAIIEFVDRKLEI